VVLHAVSDEVAKYLCGVVSKRRSDIKC